MMRIALLSDSSAPYNELIPSLDLLSHEVQTFPQSVQTGALEANHPDIIMIDATSALVGARNTAQMLKSGGVSAPVLMVLTEGGMAAVSATWLVDDVLLPGVGPAELEARLRLATAHSQESADEDDSIIKSGAVLIDEASYTARLDGAPLNLTYKEFELLKFLAQHTGRVFTRAQLLSEVWGYDYYGGTRTVDVHVRRLRSKLGTEHEHLISTVRNVGYCFNTPKSSDKSDK